MVPKAHPHPHPHPLHNQMKQIELIEAIEKLESNRPLGLCQTPSWYILYIFIFLFRTPFFPSFSLWLPFPTPSQQDYTEVSGGAAWYQALRNPCIGITSP